MKHLAKLLIIVGILLLLLPEIGSIYIKYEQRKMYQAYLENLSQMEDAMQTMNETLASGEEAVGAEIEQEVEGGISEGTQEEVQEEEVIESLPTATQTPNGLEVIGIVSIPKIDIDLMFVEGVTKQALKFAVGHMPGTGMPGEVGNCAIAGHRSYTFGEYFNRLDEVEVGDEIQITMGKETYTYKVYESFLVEPTEVWVTGPIENKKIVTLITCHPVVKATHRLIVRGELVE